MSDPKVKVISQIIHDADLGDEKFGHSEGIALDHVLIGWAQQGLSDEGLLRRGIELIEAGPVGVERAPTTLLHGPGVGQKLQRAAPDPINKAAFSSLNMQSAEEVPYVKTSPGNSSDEHRSPSGNSGCWLCSRRNVAVTEFQNFRR